MDTLARTVCVVCALVCGASPSAIAQCNEGWHRDPSASSGTAGYCCTYPTDANDLHNNQTCYRIITCTPTYDSVRQINSDSGPGTTGTTMMYYYTGYYSVPGCGYISGHGEWAQSPSYGWPPIGSARNGYYAIKCYVRNTTEHSYTMYAWLIDGVWTTDPPQPAQPAVPAPTGTPTSAGTGGGIALTVTRSADGGAVGGLWVTLSGPSPGVIQVDGTGHMTQDGLSPGTYTVALSGNMLNSAGTVKSVVGASMQVYVVGGQRATVSMSLADDGTMASQSGGGTSSAGSYGWLADIMRSLFVPQQSTVDGLRSSAMSFVSWGPFALLTELATATVSTNTTQTGIVMPVIGSDAGCGCVKVTGTTPINGGLGMITNTTGWSVIRAVMGGVVWVIWCMTVAHYLMPRMVTS